MKMNGVLLFAAVTTMSICYSGGIILKLHRTVPLNLSEDFDSLVHRDHARHQQRLIGKFDLSGDLNFARMYYTTIELGSPPQEFNVLVDTGSELSWVSCISCTNCPIVSSLPIKLNFYDASNSSTASALSCSKRCRRCTPQDNMCAYDLEYDDGSKTSGEFYTDLLQIHPFSMGFANSSFPVTFGCSTNRSGLLAQTPTPVDGVLGLGQGSTSILKQLSSQGITPNVISHCFEAGYNGGGILVIGEILHSSMVYSPLVPNEINYSLNLLNISVDGKLLSISSITFPTKSTVDVIIDSGTTLAYLKGEVYDAITTAITAYVSKKAQPHQEGRQLCYNAGPSGASFFPPVTFIFDQDAHLVLRPEDYLIQFSFLDPLNEWCIGFRRAREDQHSILGVISLRDRIFVYDSYRKQLGWSTHVNCSSSLTVNSTYGFSNDGYEVSATYRLLIFFFAIPLFYRFCT